MHKLSKWQSIRHKYQILHLTPSEQVNYHWRKCLKKLVIKTLKFLKQQLSYLATQINIPKATIKEWLKTDIDNQEIQQAAQKWLLQESGTFAKEKFIQWLIRYLSSEDIQSLQQTKSASNILHAHVMFSKLKYFEPVDNCICVLIQIPLPDNTITEAIQWDKSIYSLAAITSNLLHLIPDILFAHNSTHYQSQHVPILAIANASFIAQQLKTHRDLEHLLNVLQQFNYNGQPHTITKITINYQNQTDSFDWDISQSIGYVTPFAQQLGKDQNLNQKETNEIQVQICKQIIQKLETKLQRLEETFSEFILSENVEINSLVGNLSKMFNSELELPSLGSIDESTLVLQNPTLLKLMAANKLILPDRWMKIVHNNLNRSHIII